MEPLLHRGLTVLVIAATIHPGDFQRRKIVGVDAPYRQTDRFGALVLDFQPDGLDVLFVQWQTEETLCFRSVRYGDGDGDRTVCLRYPAGQE